MARRENTFRIDLANVPKRPSYEEIHNFVATELGLQRHQVQRIQCSRSANCVFVKVTDLELAQKICEEHDEKHGIELDGQRHVLRIRMEDGAVEVKLFDLPEDISELCITEFLSSFGEVLSVREQMWTDQYTFGGTSTGVWIARMLVKRNIPSYVVIDGETTFLSYYGQHQTCKHCGDYVHNGASCIQNKKLQLQKLSADQTSKQTYSSVTKQSTKTRATAPRSTKQTTTTATSKQAIPAEPVVAASTSTATKVPVVVLTPAFKKPTTTTQQHQQQHHKLNRISDGAETDDSIASSGSRRSRRHLDKKPRYDDGDFSHDEGIMN